MTKTPLEKQRGASEDLGRAPDATTVIFEASRAPLVTLPKSHLVCITYII